MLKMIKLKMKRLKNKKNQELNKIKKKTLKKIGIKINLNKHLIIKMFNKIFKKIN